MAPRFDLVVTESDSGGAGISTGGFSGVAFVLDSRRNKLVTTPPLRVPDIFPSGAATSSAVTRDRDPYKQFPGRSLFIFNPAELLNGRWGGPTGVLAVTATGGGMAPFTFHLVEGVVLQSRGSPSVAVNQGEIVVQEWNEACGDPSPPGLAAPAFELVQSEFSVTRTLVPASLQFTFKRRAYRVLQPTEWPAPSATPYVFAKCLPEGFSRYPLMTFPGGKSPTCTWDIPANDSGDNVFKFYKAQLNEGQWRIASIEGSTITFADHLNYIIGGTVTVDSVGNVHVTAGISDSSNGPWDICQTSGH